MREGRMSNACVFHSRRWNFGHVMNIQIIQQNANGLSYTCHSRLGKKCRNKAMSTSGASETSQAFGPRKGPLWVTNWLSRITAEISNKFQNSTSHQRRWHIISYSRLATTYGFTQSTRSDHSECHTSILLTSISKEPLNFRIPPKS